MNINTKFAKRVKKIRLKRDLSQEALALLAGLDRTYISSIETGKRNVSLIVIQKIANALNVNISKLFKGLK